MGSTPDFHQVIRETSSNENMPASPAPTMVSFTQGSSPGYFCEHFCGSEIDADGDTRDRDRDRDRIGSLGTGTGTSSTFEVESPPLK